MRAEPKPPEAVLAAIRAPFMDAGGELADPPILQPLGLLLDLAGEALRERLFVVQAEGGEEACLRPDFTIPLARAHLERGAESGRYVYEGRAFRAAGGDGYEEFLQLGLETHRSSDGWPEDADVEIAVLAWRAAAAGERADLALVLGDALLFGLFLEALGLPAPATERLKRLAGRPRMLAAELDRSAETTGSDQGRLASLLATAPEVDAARILEEVWALAGITPVGGRSAAEIAHRLAVRDGQGPRAPLPEAAVSAIRAFQQVEGPAEAALEQIARLSGGGASRLLARLGEWRTRCGRLVDGGVPLDRLRFSAAPGRSFDYYDGARFEILSDGLGPLRPVGAGGRYDGLLARLGGRANAAVGCMIRPWRAWAGGDA